MGYEKQTWQTGDVITATKLNHMEDGIASTSVLIVLATLDAEEEEVVLDKTWQEIKNAVDSGTIVMHYSPDEGEEYSVAISFINAIYEASGTYTVEFGGMEFSTDSADGYPMFSMK